MVDLPQPPPYPETGPVGGYQYPATPQYRANPQMPLGSGVVLAKWWKRVVAYLIDAIVLAIPLGIIAIIIIGNIHETCTVVTINGVASSPASCTPIMSGWRLIAFSLLSLVIVLTYFGILDGSTRGQTLGKRSLNIATRDASSGLPIGPIRAALRMFIMYVLSLPLLLCIPGLLDVLWPLWDPRRQCWHDKVVGSVVVDLAGLPLAGVSAPFPSALESSFVTGIPPSRASSGSLRTPTKKDVPQLIMVVIIVIAAIVIMVILVNRVSHSTTRLAQQTTIPVPPASSLHPVTSSPEKAPVGSSFNDNFRALRNLSSSDWATTSSSIVSGMATISSEPAVAPDIGFTSSGMTMAGASGPDQFAGISSVKVFAPPFTLIARVTGNVSSGNPFGLVLINQRMTQYIDIAGNLNPGNGAYGIRYDTQNGPPGYLGVNGSDLLVANPRVDAPYILSMSINPSGSAYMEVQDSSGGVLGSAKNIRVGRGPFYIVLAQWEGTPTTEGPNLATWSSLSLRHN